jgi:type VI secretion system protein ImpE
MIKPRTVSGMSAAESLFRSGDLSGSLAELQKEVRQRPADSRLRVFLAQLLMISGDWQRALNQLGVAGELDAAALPMLHAYRAAIQCEQVRAGVFKGERSPLVLGDPEPWLAQLIHSLSLQTQGSKEQADAARAEALEQAPATSGTLNGEPFEWIADADSRLGPVLEVLLNGVYYWVPFNRIKRVVAEPPADARDLVWLPAQFTWSNGGEAMGLIPARYPGSELSTDDAVRLCRRTEWTEIGGSAFAGTGQRVLATNENEYGLLDLRTLELNTDG